MQGFLNFSSFSQIAHEICSCIFQSLDIIFFIGNEILRVYRIVFELPILGYLGVWGYFGYLATSNAKSDVIFLISDPDFLQGWWNFARISHSFLDLMHCRIDNRRQTTDGSMSVWA